MEFTAPLSYTPAYRAPNFQKKARNARPNKASFQKKKQNRNAPNNPRNPRDSVVIKAPVAMTKINRTGVPRMDRLSNGDLVVSHREFLQDIPASVDFRSTGIPVNPGLSETFPWLSQMATLYESYCFEKLDFAYQTMSSTTQSGSVMLAIDYDASDPSPIDKQQMASYRGYSRSSPWENFTNHSKKEDISKRKTYYVRNGGLGSNQDVKLYDVGNLFVATQGQAPDTPPVGELYVDYRVKLMTPQLNNPALGNSKSSVFTTASNTAVVTAPGSNAPIVATGSGNVVTLTATAAFQGLLSTLASGTGTVAIAYTGTASSTENFAVLNSTSGFSSSGVELSFLPGQTCIVTASDPAASLDLRLGQFNVAL